MTSDELAQTARADMECEWCGTADDGLVEDDEHMGPVTKDEIGEWFHGPCRRTRMMRVQEGRLSS